MIYLFSGNSNYLVREKTNSWKKSFLDKHGDFDLIHIKDISSTTKNFLTSNLTGASFFGGKKLIIIDGVPSGAKKRENKTTKKDSRQSSTTKDLEEYITSIIENIPDDNIVLFSSVNPDKRGKLFKKLKEVANHEDFSINDISDIHSILNKKYKDRITSRAIELIIRYKSSNLDKIISELDKLLITCEKIEEKDITNNITPELEESIFQLIDDILNLRKKELLNKLNIILELENIYGFYNNLLANLRTNYYIFSLKNMGLSNNEISKNIQLGNRVFLLNKNYKIKAKEFIKFYYKLLEIDKTMKSGKLVGTTEIDFRYELEKTFLMYL